MKSITMNTEILESVFSSMSNGVIVVDHHKKVLLMNASAQTLLKQGQQAYIGKDIREIVPN